MYLFLLLSKYQKKQNSKDFLLEQLYNDYTALIFKNALELHIEAKQKMPSRSVNFWIKTG